jgi:Putative F0F1-ATPase subunit Ca2+/Mg2+ transporter
VLAILILGELGHWLDERYWGGRSWGMAVGFVFGVAVGARNLIRAASRMQKDVERAEARDPEASRWTVDESWLHKSEPPSVAHSDSEQPSRGTAGRDTDDLPS